MEQKNLFHEEVDISRLYQNQAEIKHKTMIVKLGSKNQLIIKNLSEKILEVRCNPDLKSLFFFIKPGESRAIPENHDAKNHKLYIRLLEKP